MLFFDASLSLCSQKKMNDESVPGQKKLLIGPSLLVDGPRCRKKGQLHFQRCTNVIVNASFTRSLTNVAHYWLIFLVNWNFCEWTWLIFLVNWNLSSQRCMEGGHNLTQIIHYLSQIIHYYNFFFSNFHKKDFQFIFRKKIKHIFGLHHELSHKC